MFYLEKKQPIKIFVLLSIAIVYSIIITATLNELNKQATKQKKRQETFSAPSADKQTQNYDIEFSNHNPSQPP